MATSTYHICRDGYNNITKIDFTFIDTDGEAINGALYPDGFIYNKDRNFSHRMGETSGAYSVFVYSLLKYFS